MKLNLLLCGLLILGSSSVALAKHEKETESKEVGLRDAIVLIIRHAEKPEGGPSLAPEGEKRAEAYVNYFKNYKVNGESATPETLFAAADSTESRRPRLTIEPLSKALGVTTETPHKDKQFAEMAKDLENKPHSRHILICWHHGEIPNLVKALGADSAKLIPDNKWPAHVFGWVIQLRYDHEGHLTSAERIEEHLMPDDK